jgi:hypothetical protein
MKLAIVGSRSFKNKQLLEEVLDPYKHKVTLVISGGAIGADKMGEYWAKSNNIPVKIHYPEWEKYGKQAGFIRNRLIIEDCDECIAFWDGKSKGTQNSIFIAENLDKKVNIVKYEAN